MPRLWLGLKPCALPWAEQSTHCQLSNARESASACARRAKQDGVTNVLTTRVSANVQEQWEDA
eukprot:3598855-Prorocentrum_lima.AAC.1